MLILRRLGPSSALAALHARANYPQTVVLHSAGAAAGEQSIHGRIARRFDKSQTAAAAKSKLLLIMVKISNC
jgi:hypothetical protein